VRGGLSDLDAIREAAAAADGVIHLAFIHDFADSSGAVGTGRLAIDAIGSALAGTDKPLIAAATVPIAPGRIATEEGDGDTTAGLDLPVAGSSPTRPTLFDLRRSRVRL
jgi:hypothetical protein